MAVSLLSWVIFPRDYSVWSHSNEGAQADKMHCFPSNQLEKALTALQTKTEYLPGPPESPTYSTEGQTEQAYPPSLFNRQQIFSSLEILKDAPTSAAGRSNLPSASPIAEFDAFSNEHIDEAEVAAILLENKTVGWVL